MQSLTFIKEAPIFFNNLMEEPDIKELQELRILEINGRLC